MVKVLLVPATALGMLLSLSAEAAAQVGGRADAPKSCSEAYGRCNSTCGGGRGRGQVDTCLNFCTTTRASCLSTGTWQGNRNVWQGLARN
jgi:hypothetical protein